MKKMNRLAAMILAGAMAAAVLAGCGAQTPAAAPAAPAAPAEAAAPAAEAAEPGKVDLANATGRLKTILEKGVIQVTTEPYFAPQEFIDPSKTGQDQYVGADMELAKLIAERLGVQLEIVPLEFGPTISSVVEGKYDLAISALAYTPERAEALELSDGYHFEDASKQYGLLIRKEDAENIKSAEDLADRTVVTQSGSLQEALVLDQIPKYKEFKRVSSMSPDAFLSVQEGKADAAAVAVENAQLYIDNNPDCNMMIVDSWYFTIDEKFGGTRIGAPKGETDLINAVNEVIAEINESGQYEEWFEEYAAYAASLGL